MQKYKFLFAAFVIVAVGIFSSVVAQNKTVVPKSVEKLKEKKEGQRNRTERREVENDIDPLTFRSPFRYIIVYNDVSETEIPTRGLDVLIDEKYFNEQNLKQLFQLLDKRFPTPGNLIVNVWTSLETVDTPEERDVGNYSLEAGRLTDEINKHKDAFYVRYDNGYKRLSYTVSLSPKRQKVVEITNP